LVKGAGCQAEPAIRPIWVIIGFNPRQFQGPKGGMSSHATNLQCLCEEVLEQFGSSSSSAVGRYQSFYYLPREGVCLFVCLLAENYSTNFQKKSVESWHMGQGRNREIFVAAYLDRVTSG